MPILPGMLPPNAQAQRLGANLPKTESPGAGLIDNALARIARLGPAAFAGPEGEQTFRTLLIAIDGKSLTRSTPAARGPETGVPSPLASSSPTSQLQGAVGPLDQLALQARLRQARGGPQAPGAAIPGGGTLGRPPIAPSSVPSPAGVPGPLPTQGNPMIQMLQQLASRGGLGGLA